MLDLTPQGRSAIGLGLKVATAATLAAAPFALLVAYALARWRFPGHGAPNAVTHLPLALPAVVTGSVLLLLFGRQLARSLGASPLWAFALAEFPLALPGVRVGMILGFAKALGEFGATITFLSSILGETRTIPAAIYSLIQAPDGDAAAMRLAALSAVIAVVAPAVSELLQRRARPIAASHSLRLGSSV